MEKKTKSTKKKDKEKIKSLSPGAKSVSVMPNEDDGNDEEEPLSSMGESLAIQRQEKQAADKAANTSVPEIDSGEIAVSEEEQELMRGIMRSLYHRGKQISKVAAKVQAKQNGKLDSGVVSIPECCAF